MRRIAHLSFYDRHGRIDDYVYVLIDGLRPFVDELHFSSNGPLSNSSFVKIIKCVDSVQIRPNEGFDAMAHKEFIDRIKFARLAEFDEVVLLNHTCFGPVFPFSEMFTEMESRKCDLWGPMGHKEVNPNPFTGVGALPFHITANFIVFRRSIVNHESFRHYWSHMPNVSTYEKTIYNHETLLTRYFTDQHFVADTYCDMEKYGSRYPGMFDVADTMRDRNPLLKRRAFFHEAWYLESEGTDLPRALRYIRDAGYYDMGLIWQNISRSGEPRNITVNAALTAVYPDYVDPKLPKLKISGKIALCAHVYYVEMIEELLSYSDNIPFEYDFIATTDTEEKAKEIRKQLGERKSSGKNIVLVMDQNRGRDMAALFITCRDIFLTDEYEFVCRLHTKKSPQVGATKSNIFKRHLYENLLNSPGYVQNVLRLMAENPYIGVAVPPLVNLSFSHFGHAWYANRPMTEDLVHRLGLEAHLDSDTPIAIYGTMFWFRPKALRKLFEHKWEWSEFNPEPHHVDGGLAHALERLTCYAAQDAGYITYQILNADSAAQNYSSVEYKLQKVQSYLDAGEFKYYHDLLGRWRASGYPTTAASSVNIPQPYYRTVRSSARELWYAIKRSVAHRCPKLLAAYRLVRHFRSQLSMQRNS